MLQVAFIRLVIAVLLATRTLGSVTVSSYIRTPEKNAAEGGLPNSLHLTGLAIDLAADPATIARLAAVWRAIGLDAAEYADHVHLELDGPLLRT